MRNAIRVESVKWGIQFHPEVTVHKLSPCKFQSSHEEENGLKCETPNWRKLWIFNATQSPKVVIALAVLEAPRPLWTSTSSNWNSFPWYGIWSLADSCQTTTMLIKHSCGWTIRWMVWLAKGHASETKGFIWKYLIFWIKNGSSPRLFLCFQPNRDFVLL